MSCGVGCRRGSDPTLLWLWRRLVATALIRRLAWEPPYATGVAQEKAKKKKEKETDFRWMKSDTTTISTAFYRSVFFILGSTAN